MSAEGEAATVSAPAAAADVLDTPEAGRRVVRGGAIRVGGFVAGVGASVLGAALVTRHLGPEDYGRFQTVVALVTIVAAVTDLGMSTLSLREYAQRDGEARVQFLRVLLGLRLVLTTLGVGVAAGVAVLLGYDGQMVAGAALMGIGVLLSVAYSTLATPLAAEIRMGVVTGLDVSRQIMVTLGYVVLVVAGAGIVPFLGVVIPVHAVLLVVTLLLVRHGVSLRPSFDRAAWIGLIRPTISFALATTVGTLYTYTALVLTSLVTSEHETGLFAASFRVFAIVAAVPGILVTTAFPLLSRAARHDRERLRYATQRLFEGTAVLGGAALIGCVVGAVPIIDVVAGAQYHGSVAVLRVQGVALALSFVIATWGFTLLAMHRQRQMIYANAAALMVTAVTVLVLGHAHGARGAAFGTLLGEATLALGYVRVLVAGDPLLRPRFGLVARAVPALALGLSTWLLPVPPVAGVALALAVYGVALVVFRAVPDELWDHLPAPVGRIARRGEGGR